MISELAWTALIAASAVSVLCWFVGGRLVSSNEKFKALGQKAYDRKTEALAKPPLSWYQDAVERGAFAPGFTIIFLAILLKSVMSAVLGIIVIFYLPLGVMIMPALVAAHGTGDGLRRWAAQVTIVQGASHLFAAAVGFAVTWVWIKSDSIGLMQIVSSNQGVVTQFLVASLVLAAIAAWIETDGHMNKGFLQDAG